MYDLAIIGGGSSGYSAAFEAVLCGMSVILFEREIMGGTCLNRGCVPTKFLTHVARKYYEFGMSENEGFTFQSMRLEFHKTLEHMNEIVSSLRKGLEQQLDRTGVTVVKGEAIIINSGLIVCDGHSYETKNILIATGSAPAIPIVTGAITSDEFLKSDKIPEHLHIIGGGTIAVEFADVFRMLGSDVTISIRADRILRKWDREIAVGITQSLKKKGIRINRNCDFSSFKPSSDEVLLSAVGRKAVLPETKADLFDTGADGGICVDKNGQTKTRGVFAAGDVVECSPQLAHVAMEQGRRIVRMISGKNVEKESVLARCIYLDQEAASAGLTEAEAKEREIEIVSAKQNMFSNARTLISTQERGFIKILADKHNRKIVGGQLMCERAGDIVPEIVLAINQGITVDEMLCSVRPHPGYAEAVTETLRSLKGKLDAV